MAQPTDYLLGAAVSLMRSADNSALATIDDLKAKMEGEFNVHLDETRLDFLSKRLEKYGFIDITNDQYAGSYITPLSGWGVSSRINRFREANKLEGFIYVLDSGSRLMQRAFENKTFWADLDAEIESPSEDNAIEDEPIEDTVPTADGFVSLSHNQFKEIDEPTGELLEELDRDNGIPDQPGLKERLAGQIRAGRELLRAGEFALSTFKATMLSGLEELKNRYGDHAIGAGASALLTLILHILEMPGF